MVFRMDEPDTPQPPPDPSLVQAARVVREWLETDGKPDRIVLTRGATVNLERRIAAFGAAQRAHVEQSMIRHFQEEHLAGDGPEIDRYKRAMKTGAQQVEYAREAFERGEFDAVSGALKNASLIWRAALRAARPEGM